VTEWVKLFCTVVLVSVLTNLFYVQPSIAKPEIITVPDNYLQIQEAINHANPEDTIYVKAGTYPEHIIIEKNNLKIIGENKCTTIIDGQDTDTVVNIKANNTVFQGFTIRNSGHNSTDSGINTDHSINSQISNNNVIECNLGLYLHASSNITLRNNTMTTNQYNFGVYGDNLQEYIQDIDTTNTVNEKPIIYWVGKNNEQPPVNAGYIAIINSTNMTLQDLTLSKNWPAILLAYSTNSDIKNITATNNMDCIWILNCTACSLTNSTISDNNWGGIALVDSSACSIHDNNINNNAEYGVLLSDSSNNSFYHNNFINNTSQVWLFGANSNNWDNGYSTGGNFWSDHSCTDEKRGVGQNQTGNDGICDLPFTIDSNNTDQYPLTTPWKPQSLQSLSISLVSCIVAGLVILITCVLILYSVKIRKQKSSIRNLRFHNYARNWFCLFLFGKRKVSGE
jgi:parallel beta-helix repeat protein